jgi:hypothetical protein
MAGDAAWRELRDEIKVYSSWAASTLMEGVFITLWVSVQWLVGKAMGVFELEARIDRGVLLAFQFLFAVSTLAPVVLYIYTNTRILILRARRKIQLEMELSQANESHG